MIASDMDQAGQTRTAKDANGVNQQHPLIGMVDHTRTVTDNYEIG